MAVRLLVALSSALLSACSASDTVIGVGQRLHHDDFEYSVQRVEQADRIGDRQANGIFYIVTFQVENRAGRVEHRWTNDIAYVIDGDVRQYENIAAAQRALSVVRPFGYKEGYVTPAQGTDTTMLVFDVPKDVREPYLKVRGGFLMGDVFDANQYQRTRIRLF